jgi:hypothetical protein
MLHSSSNENVAHLSTSPPRKIFNEEKQIRIKLFVRKGFIGPKLINTLIHVKNLLNLKGIFEGEIQEILLDNDHTKDPVDLKEITERLEFSKGPKFPIIFIRSRDQFVLVGNVTDLEQWIISGKLDSIIEEEESFIAGSASVDMQAFQQRLQEVQQQKQLLEDQAKIAEREKHLEALEELKLSIFQIDRDYSSLTEILTRTSKQSNPTESYQNQSNKPRKSSFSSSSPSPSSSSSSSSSSSIEQTRGEYQQIQQKQAQQQLSSQEDRSSPEYLASYLGKAFSTSKWAVSNVTSAAFFSLSSVADYVSSTWKLGSTIRKSDSSSFMSNNSFGKELKDENGVRFIEYEVIQVNWFWRQQKRLLRFSSENFFRLNPFTREIRAVHKYSTIEELVITGKTFLSISFNDSSPTEFYQSADIERIIATIVSFSKPHTRVPVIWKQEESSN